MSVKENSNGKKSSDIVTFINDGIGLIIIYDIIYIILALMIIILMKMILKLLFMLDLCLGVISISNFKYVK